MKILYLGAFRHSFSTENEIARALERAGHEVTRLEESEALRATISAAADELRPDVLLVAKARFQEAGHEWPNDARAVADLIEQVRPAVGRVACWLFDLLAEEFSPARFDWARTIAPACELFVTTDGHTAPKLPGAVVVRQGAPDEIDAEAGWPEECRPEEYEGDVLFLGLPYGDRKRLVEACFARFGQRFRAVNDCRGPELTRLVRSYRLVVGPHWPHFAGYWSNRIYIVAGHGGLFAAPPVEGLSAEGWRASGNYLALPRDPAAMADKLAEYLHCDLGQLRAIQQAGHAHARQQCSYDCRVAELLALLSDAPSQP
ncbi:MAG TPA: glycosyltransferase [Pirellulales bacterium]|nr:glycosyltransferase [Pirellulales bacterium]